MKPRATKATSNGFLHEKVILRYRNVLLVLVCARSAVMFDTRGTRGHPKHTILGPSPILIDPTYVAVSASVTFGFIEETKSC